MRSIRRLAGRFIVVGKQSKFQVPYFEALAMVNTCTAWRGPKCPLCVAYRTQPASHLQHLVRTSHFNCADFSRKRRRTALMESPWAEADIKAARAFAGD
jgi:hypothetical protein